MTTHPVPSRQDGVRYLFMLAAFVVIIAGIRAAESILNPLLLAIFLSIMCAPTYFGLMGRGVAQWLALLIVTGGLMAIAIVLLAVVMDSISGFTARQDHYRDLVNQRRQEIQEKIESWLPDSMFPRNDRQPIENTRPNPEQSNTVNTTTMDVPAPADMDDRMTEPHAAASAESGDLTALNPGDGPWSEIVWSQFDPRTVISLAARLAGSIGNLLSRVLLIMLTVVFILLEAGTFVEKLRRAFSRREDTSRQADQIIKGVQRYMAIKTLMSLATAVLIGIWLWLFGVPYVALWALIAFLLNFIPNIGSILAAIPAVLIAWLELTIWPAVGCALGYLLVNMGIGNFLEPHLMGRGLGVSPLVIFCSMIFWGWVLGPVGMLLSVPLTMTAYIVLNGFDDTRWIATLMGGSTGSEQ